MNASLDVFEEVHLPWSLDAEKATLGAILVQPSTWRDVADAVSADDFYRDVHRALFTRMTALAAQGRAIDAVTLTAGLGEAQTEAIGGLLYLTQLTNGLPRAANAVHYAEIVRDFARRRTGIQFAQRLITEAQGGDDFDAARASAEQALRELETGRSVDTATSAEVAGEALDYLDEMGNAPGGITGVRTGFSRLDQMTGGLQRSELHIVAARPSVGKTALLGQLATQAAMVDGVPTVIVTLEQPRRALQLRMASNLAQVDLMAVRHGIASERDLSRLSEALERLSRAPLTFVDHRDLRMSDVQRRLRRLSADGRCGYVLVDYLGLVQPEKAQTRGENRQEQVAAQSRLAKGIARELDIPFVLLCQLNREYEKDAGARAKKAEPRRPRLSDLRESGAIEQDADTVLFVHRPYVRPRNETEAWRESETELILAKQRNGPIGSVSAVYTKEHVRFDEVAD